MSLTEEQLRLLDETREVRIETSSGSKSTKTVIWVVVVNGTVCVRSVSGGAGRWYQRTLSNPEVAIHVDGDRIEFRAEHVDDSDEIAGVTEALRAKYPPGGSLDRMTRNEVLDHTLRLEPIDP